VLRVQGRYAESDAACRQSPAPRSTRPRAWPRTRRCAATPQPRGAASRRCWRRAACRRRTRGWLTTSLAELEERDARAGAPTPPIATCSSSVRHVRRDRLCRQGARQGGRRRYRAVAEDGLRPPSKLRGGPRPPAIPRCGRSSRHTSANRNGRAPALARLEKEQMPLELRGVARERSRALAPGDERPQPRAAVNLWLFRPLVESQLKRWPSANASLRTTTRAPPSSGRPGRERPARVARVRRSSTPPPAGRQSARRGRPRRARHRNPAIKVERCARTEASRVAASDGAVIARSRADSGRAQHPASSSAPALMIGADRLALLRRCRPHVYKFSPVRASPRT
jgi:hypothetical protein